MSWMVEYDEGGEIIREGYLGEAECPVCGAPTTAVFYESGGYDILSQCWYCTTKDANDDTNDDDN